MKPDPNFEIVQVNATDAELTRYVKIETLRAQAPNIIDLEYVPDPTLTIIEIILGVVMLCLAIGGYGAYAFGVGVVLLTLWVVSSPDEE